MITMRMRKLAELIFMTSKKAVRQIQALYTRCPYKKILHK